jgi:C_GCAxxG_C_C family probable redox protein
MRTIDPVSAVNRADELSCLGWNCAESVFTAIHEQAGEGETPVQLLTALGGGMGCKRTCGALTGAAVSLGLAYGRTSPDEGAKKLASAKARKLCEGFREKFHSIDCWELTSGYDNEQDRKRGCRQLIGTAVELVCGLMAESSRTSTPPGQPGGAR